MAQRRGVLLDTIAPRLSGMLRSTAVGGAFDPNEAAIARREAIRRKRDRAEAKLLKQTRWSDFETARSLEKDDRVVTTNKELYGVLLQSAREMAPSLTPQELQRAVLQIYEVCKPKDDGADDEEMSDAAKEKLRTEQRHTLEEMFGAFAPHLMGPMVRCSERLHRWISGHLTKAGIKPTEGSSLMAAESEADRVEWDGGLDFNLGAPRPLQAAPVATKLTRYQEAGRQRKREAEQTAGVEAGAADGSMAYDAHWLRAICAEHAMHAAAAAGGSRAGGTVDADELAIAIYRSLSSKSSDEALQIELFELLGADSFELMGELLAHRKDVVANQDSMAIFFTGGPQPTAQRNQGGRVVGPPAVGVTIISQEQRKLDKLAQKNNRKQMRAQNQQDEVAASMGIDLTKIKQQREAELQRNAQAEELLAPGTVTGFGQQTALPMGTVRVVHKEWEEVKIPARTAAPFGANERLVDVKEFSEFGQKAFKGFKSLNRIQSRLFKAAYHSNENLLICAPTGAGKTNVAVMTMLHEIESNIVNGVVNTEAFKIVYVAPMKALAAEMTASFSKRLAPLGITVKELTGDMQLSKKELTETQVIVTTPEKWDVISRKSGDVALTSLVRLLIFDEVHLLHDGRGPVIESLVARTLRLVESSQSMIRIVGLSATLPGYQDVATFLRVNHETGLFFFDNSYRPVPLAQQFIGISDRSSNKLAVLHQICYDKVLESVKAGNQVMVFVHSRKDTVKTAETLFRMATRKGEQKWFNTQELPGYKQTEKQVMKSRNRELRELYANGFGIHHAGMLRPDRTLTESLFSQGLVRVLVCTATLAWGVNLPAHTVVIKGTSVYNTDAGGFMELGMLDVMQIFGRAGRPQFDTSGEAILITGHENLAHYLNLLNNQMPIESQFMKKLPDNLNAEIVLGTVTNIDEAIEWLTYTYLNVRMRANPLLYGVAVEEVREDPQLIAKRRLLVENAALTLDRCRMARYDQRTGTLSVTDLGRTASHYYVLSNSIEGFNERLRPDLEDADILAVVAQATEFEQIKVREEEMKELDTLMRDACPIRVKGGVENTYGKVIILLQAYISNRFIDNFALVSDTNYVVQNAGRIVRALFEVSIKKGWPTLADKLLLIGKEIERRQWRTQTPLRQFRNLKQESIQKIEEKDISLDQLADMSASEIGASLHHQRIGEVVKMYVNRFPHVNLSAELKPITRNVLRVVLSVRAEFTWNEADHGSVEPWWVWVQDGQHEHIYHAEQYLLHKKMMTSVQKLEFTMPIFEPRPPQYYIRMVSDRWIGAEVYLAVELDHLVLPDQYPPHTALLDLQPLPVTVLKNPAYESLYRFSHFNPIQTQVFHTLMHTDHHVLLGAPTGSGKTIAAELAMFRVFNTNPSAKIVYIAPLKALVRERIIDWGEKLCKITGKEIAELTGDVNPDIAALNRANIVITTPEKWDGISRNWRQRSYVQKVALIIIDEIHLLGSERGAILEVIVSRMHYIAAHKDTKMRIVGLSTALANAVDLAAWLDIGPTGLFNFHPSIRPVPLDVHIAGFPGKHYCPRMATMNKPTYRYILQHSPDKPVLVFVSSRRQTRLTALDLIAYCASSENPRQFNKMESDNEEMILSRVRDPNLKNTLQFGIGLHHAGLTAADKSLVEELFVNNKIQILVSTSTLAWGVNFPAHLVVVKGTEFFDPKTKRYVDYPITDVLQMMGRAGRPQFDQQGVACILVEESKKNFYKKFLYEPFPVESSLQTQLHDHLNAEIVSGTISNKQDALDYLSWTYFYRRLLQNPSYYGLESTDKEAVDEYLTAMIERHIEGLKLNQCVNVASDDFTLEASTLGRIASYYYLHYKTMGILDKRVVKNLTAEKIVTILCGAHEFEELPVRHNEDQLNADMAKRMPWHVPPAFDSPHVKANLLLQAHFARASMPIADYLIDQKLVLDQATRVMQAMIDVAADRTLLSTVVMMVQVLQTIVQGRWMTESSLLTLPHVDGAVVASLARQGLEVLPQLMALKREELAAKLAEHMPPAHVEEVLALTHERLPLIDVRHRIADKDKVARDAEVSLDLTLHRVRGAKNRYAPRFPKTSRDGWVVVLGDLITDEVYALKRVTCSGANTQVNMPFFSPEAYGPQRLGLFILSDSYIGLDQQYDVTFTTVDP